MSRHPLLRNFLILPLLVLGAACGDVRGEAGDNPRRNGGGQGGSGGGPGGGPVCQRPRRPKAGGSRGSARSGATRSDGLGRRRFIPASEYGRDRAALASAQETLEGLKTRL